MGRLTWFVCGMIVGAVVVFGSQKYHILRTDDGIEVVPKVAAGFSETYVDVRSFDAADWMQHKQLAAAVIKADKQQLFRGAAVEGIVDGVQGILSGLDGGDTELR